MADQGGMRQRQRAWDVPIWILIFGGGLAIILAFTGWMLALQGPDYSIPVRIEESIYRALTVNTLGDSYARPVGAGTENYTAQVLLITARWLGAFVFFTTLLKVVLGLFLESILANWCRTTWRDHIVVIGGREFAFNIAETAADVGLKVVHFWPGGKEDSPNGILTLDSDQDLATLLDVGAAHRARSVVFAQEDNARSAEQARLTFTDEAFVKRARRASRQKLPGQAAHHGPHLFVCVDDGWFEHREELDFSFHRDETETASDGALDSVVEVISESRCAARSVLAAHPIFALREDVRQHVLIIGFGAMGEALLTEICETQRVDPDRKQIISIIDPDPTAWARFERRCPEWREVFDGAFFASEIAKAGPELDALVTRLADVPLTAAYVATGAFVDPAIAAAQLKQFVTVQIDAGRMTARDVDFPIFTCVRGGSAPRHTRIRPSATEAVMPIVPFGSWPEIVLAGRVLEHEPDTAAFNIHSVHSQLQSAAKPANWSVVEEVNRYSSRSAAAFVPTLLHAAGFDLEDWIAACAPAPPSPNDLPRLKDGAALAEDPSERVMLARLEHIRWCAERRLRGFRYDSVKDNARKRHDGLVGFDALPLANRKYNLEYIMTLSATLREQTDGTEITPRPNAPRALVRPTDFALLEETGLLKPGPRRTLGATLDG